MMRLETRKANSREVRSIFAENSRLGADGCLYLSLGGQYIHTSRVMLALQESEDTICFQTHSGSEYAFTFESFDDFKSLLAQTIRYAVKEGTLIFISRPHYRNLIDCFR